MKGKLITNEIQANKTLECYFQIENRTLARTTYSFDFLNYIFTFIFISFFITERNKRLIIHEVSKKEEVSGICLDCRRPCINKVIIKDIRNTLWISDQFFIGLYDALNIINFSDV